MPKVRKTIQTIRKCDEKIRDPAHGPFRFATGTSPFSSSVHKLQTSHLRGAGGKARGHANEEGGLHTDGTATAEQTGGTEVIGADDGRRADGGGAAAGVGRANVVGRAVVVGRAGDLGAVAVDGLDLNGVAGGVERASADLIVIVQDVGAALAGDRAGGASELVGDGVVSVGSGDDDLEVGAVLADVGGSGGGDVGSPEGALDVGGGGGVQAVGASAGNDNRVTLEVWTDVSFAKVRRTS